MFDLLVSYVCGFAKASLRGIHRNRFMNLCKARNIKLWGVSQTQDALVFYVSASDVPKLSAPAKKTDSELTIVREYGLAHFFQTHRKRIPFAVGLLLFATLIYVQSLFIWMISVTGESDYTKEEILKQVERLYVTPGTRKSEIDCEELEKNLRNDFQEIAWISCSIEGTKLSIHITETLNVYTDTSMQSPCNIVASQDCTIERIVTAAGTPVVTAGTDVLKGDILISGAVYLYDDNNEVLDTNYVSAEGQIYGICTYHYKNEIPLTYYQKEYSGEQKSYYTFSVFGYQITPYTPTCTYDLYDTVSDTKTARVGSSLYLPFSYEKITFQDYTLVRETITQEEAKRQAEEKIMKYISDLQEKGVQIMENNVKISSDAETCLAEGDLVVSQLVGVPQELQIINEE